MSVSVVDHHSLTNHPDTLLDVKGTKQKTKAVHKRDSPVYGSLPLTRRFVCDLMCSHVNSFILKSLPFIGVAHPTDDALCPQPRCHVHAHVCQHANTRYGERFVYHLKANTQLDDKSRLQITVWSDGGKLGKNECVGGMSFTLEELVQKDRIG